MRKVNNPNPAPNKSNARFQRFILGAIPKRYIPSSERSAKIKAAKKTIENAFRFNDSYFSCFLHVPSQM